jgi:hypothetical protein
MPRSSNGLGICLLSLSCGLLVCACGTTRRTPQPASGAAIRLSAQGAVAPCPEHVLATASRLTPITVVTHAAQQLLARQTIESQGTLYHLTPQNAPIDVVEALSLAVDRPPSSVTVPGVLAIHRVAVAACAERTAAASWAIHYPIPVAIIAKAAGWRFLVKTESGWRFWGNWCGAGRSRERRKSYCY